MIGTLAWKEYREHRTIWAAMACLAVVCILATAYFMAPGGVLERLNPQQGALLVFAGLVLASTYGLVCGSMLLAGEREAGTLAFLESLTGKKTPLWKTKLLMGLILTFAQAVVIGLVLFLLPRASEPTFGPSILPNSWSSMGGPVVLAALVLVSLEALIWGIFFSARHRHVLPAAGMAALVLTVVWIVTAILVNAFEITSLFVLIVASGFRLLLPATALCGSWYVFCKDDLRREARPISSRRQLVLPWLARRQGRVLELVLLATGFVVGLFLPEHGLLLWPIATIFLGVACGAAVFGSEQMEGSYRFLAAQRFPLGRIWAVKTLLWIGVALLTGLSALLGAMARMRMGASSTEHLVRLISSPTESLQQLSSLYSIGPALYLTPWFAYGFSVALLLTMVVRKTAGALLIAVLVSILATSLWVPSMALGGLSLWQVLAVPAFLLLVSRLTLWTWASDRLRWGMPALGLMGCGLLALTWIGASLWYRVAEIPDVGEPFDVEVFQASLPTPEENKAGRLIRRALAGLTSRQREVNQAFAPILPGAPKELPGEDAVMPDIGEQVVDTRTRLDVIKEMEEVLQEGWAHKRKFLGVWLDDMFKGEWADQLREAAALPLGVVCYPDQVDYNEWPILWQASRLFVVRALQLQAAGDNDGALDHFFVALGLSRQMRNQAIFDLFHSGQTIEGLALGQMSHWLKKIGPRPELLRRALDEMNGHEAQTPPLSDSVKAQYISNLSIFDNASSWLLGAFPDRMRPFRVTLLAMAWQTPWERERFDRISDAIFAGWLRAADTPFWETTSLLATEFPPEEERRQTFEGVPYWLPPTERPGRSLTRARISPWVSTLREFNRVIPMIEWWNLYDSQARAVCRVRITRLKLALALYEVQEGQPAPTLEALVPRYLAEVPLDPYSGKPFGYGVSKGEEFPITITLPYRIVHRPGFPAGQGVLWSAGQKGGADWGDIQRDTRIGSEGLIFLVPHWPKK